MTGRGLGADTCLPRSRRRFPNSKARQRHTCGSALAMEENSGSTTLATTVSSKAIAVALRYAAVSISTISPMCLRPVRMAISRPFTRIETRPPSTNIM